METKVIGKKKTKKWKYHTSHSFIHVKSGEEINFISQLYQIGVYGIINNNPSYQFNLTPSKLVGLEKKLKKDVEDGVIKDLKFGREITVIENEEGFFEEVES